MISPSGANQEIELTLREKEIAKIATMGKKADQQSIKNQIKGKAKACEIWLGGSSAGCPTSGCLAMKQGFGRVVGHQVLALRII